MLFFRESLSPCSCPSPTSRKLASLTQCLLTRWCKQEFFSLLTKPEYQAGTLPWVQGQGLGRGYCDMGIWGKPLSDPVILQHIWLYAWIQHEVLPLSQEKKCFAFFFCSLFPAAMGFHQGDIFCCCCSSFPQKPFILQQRQSLSFYSRDREDNTSNDFWSPPLGPYHK